MLFLTLWASMKKSDTHSIELKADSRALPDLESIRAIVHRQTRLRSVVDHPTAFEKLCRAANCL